MMQKLMLRTGLVLILTILGSTARAQDINKISPAEAEAVAKEAFIYGYPMVENYKTMFAYAIYKDNPEYKAPFNRIYNIARVYTPEDTTVVTPNSDTPYSFLWADLRAEPLVLGVPEIEKNRYYSLQFIDLYTYNFAYVGTAATGNGEGKFLLAGPGWKGDAPEGVKGVIRSDTDFVLVGYRTQLFNPADIDNVKKIQEGYTVEPLSEFLGEAAPPAPPKIDFPVYNPDKVESPGFYDYLSFLLQFCPTVPGDEAARAKFARIGIVPGKPFDTAGLSPEMKKALEAGMADGMKAIDEKAAATKSAADLFGTREFMKNNYLNRAVGAKMGIYGNSKSEAYYFLWTKDAEGNMLNGADSRYTLTFGKGELPPVKAFWSVTMYDGKTQLLVANPINRYLINSPMLPELKLNDDGSLTIYIQKDSPGKDKEPNWLPAPDGPIYMVLRCYWPEKAILDGEWKLPPVVRAE
ncbi:MAG: DUF1254 domain-containing protein [Thermodesulfobacteriota bacterium]